MRLISLVCAVVFASALSPAAFAREWDDCEVTLIGIDLLGINWWTTQLQLDGLQLTEDFYDWACESEPTAICDGDWRVELNIDVQAEVLLEHWEASVPYRRAVAWYTHGAVGPYLAGEVYSTEAAASTACSLYVANEGYSENDLWSIPGGGFFCVAYTPSGILSYLQDPEADPAPSIIFAGSCDGLCSPEGQSLRGVLRYDILLGYPDPTVVANDNMKWFFSAMTCARPNFRQIGAPPEPPYPSVGDALECVYRVPHWQTTLTAHPWTEQRYNVSPRPTHVASCPPA